MSYQSTAPGKIFVIREFIYASIDFKWNQHRLVQKHELDKLVFSFTRVLIHTENTALLCRQQVFVCYTHHLIVSTALSEAVSVFVAV